MVLICHRTVLSNAVHPSENQTGTSSRNSSKDRDQNLSSMYSTVTTSNFASASSQKGGVKIDPNHECENDYRIFASHDNSFAYACYDSYILDTELEVFE